MKTVDDLIADVLLKEGGFSNHPADKGGPTMRGITQTTYEGFVGHTVTVDELRAGLRCRNAQRDCKTCAGCVLVRRVYKRMFFDRWGFQHVTDETLRAQLFDFGVNSGPPRAIRWLQRVLGFLEPQVTGTMDRATIEALHRLPQRLVNDALVAARLFMIDWKTDDAPTQKTFEEGWESRALTFFQSRPPEAASR